MLARFKGSCGMEHVVEVEIVKDERVKGDGRRTVFISEIKRAEVTETGDPSRLDDVLAQMKIELDGMFRKAKGKGRNKRVGYASYIHEMTRLLRRNWYEVEDFFAALRDVTGEYVVRDGWIYRV